MTTVRNLGIVMLLLLGAVIWFGTQGEGDPGKLPLPKPQPDHNRVAITFQVEFSNRREVFVTWRVDGGYPHAQGWANPQTSPWNNFDDPIFADRGSHYELNVQAMQNTGKIVTRTCRVYVNGTPKPAKSAGGTDPLLCDGIA